MDDEGKKRLLENALKGLVKLFKAGRFYPPGHPALKAASEEARQGFVPLLKGETLTLTVRKEGFLHEEKKVAPENPTLKNLAHLFFARRILRLTLLPDLSTADLRQFARGLGIEPEAVRKMGGFQEVLQRARVTTVWINEVDLSAIHERKAELERQKVTLPEAGEEDFLAEAQKQAAGKEPGSSPEEPKRSLKEILDRLEAERDAQRYRLLLQEMLPMIPEHLHGEGRNPVVRAFTLLCRCVSDRGRSSALREPAQQALDQLSTPDVLDFLVDLFCLRGLPQKQRGHLAGILAFLGQKAVRHLMDRLASERDASVRRVLTEALIRHRSAAVPVLTEYLGDERWYVVRNAVAILGEIRDPSAANALPPLLRHQDLRVRRETVRALTRIGGNDAVGILLETVEKGDQDLRRQALLSLGAMRNTAAVPVLLSLLERPDAMSKNIDVTKEAVKALGEIGSTDAIPALIGLLGRRSFWKRGQIDEVRALAALSLGEIGSPEPGAELERATGDRSDGVSRAAYQALKQIRKGQ